MADWYKIPPSLTVSEGEYRANIDGINIVFGAVLGFVLAGADGLPPVDFMLVLVFSASIVVSILYLGSSVYRLFYGVICAIAIVFIPQILTDAFEIRSIPYLQPTLAAWAFMVVMVELMPREKPAEKAGDEDRVDSENGG